MIAIGNGEAHPYPAPVVTTIAQDVRADYRRAARLAGRLGVDMVMVEHEFGIFGGHDGDYVLSFTSELAMPYAVTLHTVSATSSPHQRQVLVEMCRDASLVFVFTQTAFDMALEQGVARPEQLRVVPHGAPNEITAVAGRTHPEVVRNQGEAYRLGLERRVRELGLVDHVSFDDRFLEVAELADLLAATHLFVTAYTGREQIVSGALTFAVAAGRPVVSTPYPYAEDLLATGAGRRVPFDDAARLLPIAHHLARRTRDGRWSDIAVRALSFLWHAADYPQRCGMHNVMSYQRTWVDNPHHGDHVGRTLQALGEVLASEPPAAIRFPLVRLFDDLCDDLAHFTPSPRTAAFALLGLCRRPDGGATRPEVRPWHGRVVGLADQLKCLYDEYADVRADWDWFEPVLSYDNARLPHALLAAGHHLGDADLVGLGLRTLTWFGDQRGLSRPPLWLPGVPVAARHRHVPVGAAASRR